METKTDSLYPFVPLENNDLEGTIKKRLSDVNIFNISIINIKEMIQYFIIKNNKSKKLLKKL